MAQNRVPRAVEKGCCEERGEFFGGGLIRPNEAPKTVGGRTGHKKIVLQWTVRRIKGCL